MNSESVIYYAVDVFEKVLHVSIKGIEYKSYDKIADKDIMFAFDPKKNVIYVHSNLDSLLQNYSLEYATMTIISKVGHEMRHAWQAMLPIYKSDFENYKNPKAVDYLSQTIELDAYAFEEMICKVLNNDMSCKLDVEDEQIHRLANDLYRQYYREVKAALKENLDSNSNIIS